MNKAMEMPSLPFARPVLREILQRLREPRRTLQFLTGPRQSGKTTLARQAIAKLDLPARYSTADGPLPRPDAWILSEWEVGRQLARESGPRGALLIIDEIQKVPQWSEVVKKLWDEDTWNGLPLRVLLLGSAPWLLQKGMTESLTGRFEVVHVPHWSYVEMAEAFGWDLDRYLFFGGYPGAVRFVPDQDRWSEYILDSIVETTVSRDVLLLSRVEKPALLRQLLQLGCAYSGQVLSFQKMMGHLQDAGSVTTLQHYLEMLHGAGLVTGLSKYSGSQVRVRGSIPKLLVLNTALMTATSTLSFEEARDDRTFWGRLVESAVGAHLVNTLRRPRGEVYYWREGNREVDFVIASRKSVLALEVKSGEEVREHEGLSAFQVRYPKARLLLAGGGGKTVESVLRADPGDWLRSGL
ncbi:MAG: ATP-binding protein [Candidatus Thermoplasmatota archaeon]|jgi:hypothetical protein|nr:ATP-binding protein [Candidatus Thermoplasmatota archaeon]